MKYYMVCKNISKNHSIKWESHYEINTMWALNVSENKSKNTQHIIIEIKVVKPENLCSHYYFSIEFDVFFCPLSTIFWLRMFCKFSLAWALNEILQQNYWEINKCSHISKVEPIQYIHWQRMILNCVHYSNMVTVKIKYILQVLWEKNRRRSFCGSDSV